jgi:hypothetical protein
MATGEVTAAGLTRPDERLQGVLVQRPVESRCEQFSGDVVHVNPTTSCLRREPGGQLVWQVHSHRHVFGIGRERCPVADRARPGNSEDDVTTPVLERPQHPAIKTRCAPPPTPTNRGSRKPCDHFVTTGAQNGRWRRPRKPVTCGYVSNVWRWRWDLNPRTACTVTRFRGVLLRPLGHATGGDSSGSGPVTCDTVAQAITERSTLLTPVTHDLRSPQ